MTFEPNHLPPNHQTQNQTKFSNVDYTKLTNPPTKIIFDSSINQTTCFKFFDQNLSPSFHQSSHLLVNFVLMSGIENMAYLVVIPEQNKQATRSVSVQRNSFLKKHQISDKQWIRSPQWRRIQLLWRTLKQIRPGIQMSTPITDLLLRLCPMDELHIRSYVKSVRRVWSAATVSLWLLTLIMLT